MPVYKNVARGMRDLGGRSVQSGESIETLVWCKNPDFVKIADFPMINSILVSKKLSVKDGEVQVFIPELNNIGEKVTRYQVHINVQCGEPIIHINSKKNKPALKLYPEARWNIRCSNRVIDSVIISWDILEKYEGIVFLIVEEI